MSGSPEVWHFCLQWPSLHAHSECSHRIKYRDSLEVCVHVYQFGKMSSLLRNAWTFSYYFIYFLEAITDFFLQWLTIVNNGQLIFHTRLDAHKVLHRFWWQTISVKILLLFINTKMFFFFVVVVVKYLWRQIQTSQICTLQRTKLSFRVSFISIYQFSRLACWWTRCKLMEHNKYVLILDIQNFLWPSLTDSSCFTAIGAEKWKSFGLHINSFII